MFRLLRGDDELRLSSDSESEPELEPESVLAPNATVAALGSWAEEGVDESCWSCWFGCGICCALPLVRQTNKNPTASTAATRRRIRPGDFRENADWFKAIESHQEARIEGLKSPAALHN